MAQHQQVPPSHTPGKKGTKPRQTDKLLNAGTRAEVGPLRKPAGACGAPVCMCASVSHGCGTSRHSLGG